MESIFSIIEYFATDPLRVLSLFGGSGGLIYLYDRFRNRKRIEVEIIEENYYSERETPNIKFKIQNLCAEPSSLSSYHCCPVNFLEKQVNRVNLY